MQKILIIDDEAPIREWLNFCIEKTQKYQVVGTACNGAEGYSLYKTYLPDIVITDIRMPMMDGLEMMQKILELNPSVYTILLTSHEEFEYARKAMNLGVAEYVLKTEITEKILRELLEKASQTQIKAALNHSESRYEDIFSRNSYLRALVLNGKTDSVSSQMLQQYNILLTEKPIIALAIQMKQASTNDYEECKIKIPQSKSISNAIAFSLNTDFNIVIANVDDLNSGSEQYNCCINFANYFLSNYSCRVGVSDTFKNPSLLKTAMVQAYEQARMGFYTDKESLFSNTRQIVRRPSNMETLKIQLNRELINQNFVKAFEIKNEIVQLIKMEQPVDIEYIKRVYIFIVDSLLRIFNEASEYLEENIEKISDQIMSCESFNMMNQILETVFSQAEQRHIFGQSEYSFAIRNAISYLKENCASPITLPEVANHVSLSAEYLSRLFKEETGVKFVVYLNNLRLKNAIKLLETTNLKVYEVAETVGYSNLSYFSTVFKKNFGQNPFDYKNNISKK